MTRHYALFALFLVAVLSRPVAAASLSGVGVIPSGGITADALFDATVGLLKQSGFPPSVIDKERGLIEASKTTYDTMNNGPDSIEERTSLWKISIITKADGSLQMAIDRNSNLEVGRQELIQFFRNVFAGRVKSSTVIVTVDGETRPLSEWKKINP